MVNLFPLLAAALCFPVGAVLKKYKIAPSPVYFYLLFLLPFLAGGFHTYAAPLTAAVLMAELIRTVRGRKQLRFVWDRNTLTVLVLVLGYCVTPLWAADKGMAVFGICRYLPLVPLYLLLMQQNREDREQALILVPVCGVIMTVISGILFLIPGLRDLVTVNGRLSGFFQYPNAYATFLLIGIALLGSGQGRTLPRLAAGAVLLAGLFLSGSRTGVLLLAVVLPGLAVVRGKLRTVYAGILSGTVILAAAAAVLFAGGSELQLIGRDLGSVFVRLLYYKDAIPVILKHPFGIGYMGYRAMEASFQTGRYSVSFVHNSILQLLLDIGWIPAAMFVWCSIKSLFSKNVSAAGKLALLTLLLHSLLEFSFQFFIFWCVVLLLWDTEGGKVRSVRKTGWLVPLLVPVFLLCLWLGGSDLLYRTGKIDTVLKLTPFHTEAMAEKLTKLSNDRELDALADRILALNPTHSLACSAKANAALMRGEVKNMIRWKEDAIACSPYATEEYCDYIDKLYALAVRYAQLGDSDSASYCLDKILEIPGKLDRVRDGTHPLAYLTTTDSLPELPAAYLDLIDTLRAS